MLVLAHGGYRGVTCGNCMMLSRCVSDVAMHGGMILRRCLERWRRLGLVGCIGIGLMDLGRRCRSKRDVGRIRIGRWYALGWKLGV